MTVKLLQLGGFLCVLVMVSGCAAVACLPSALQKYNSFLYTWPSSKQNFLCCFKMVSNKSPTRCVRGCSWNIYHVFTYFQNISCTWITSVFCIRVFSTNNKKSIRKKGMMPLGRNQWVYQSIQIVLPTVICTRWWIIMELFVLFYIIIVLKSKWSFNHEVTS